MNNIFTTLACIFILLTNAHAQSGFEKVYGGSLPDFFRSVTGTSDGGIVADGVTKILEADSVTIDQDGYVVKTNSTGDTLWTRRFGSTSNDQANGVIENAQGYLVAGWYTVAGGSIKYYAEQLDENGNQLWENFYGSATYQYCSDVIIDNNGRNILFGGGGVSSLDFYLVKTDALGNQISEASFGGSGFDFGNAIIQTSDGGYAMTGFTHTGTPGFDIYVVKCDSNLGFEWAHNYGGAFDDFGYDIAEDANGNLWILGSMELYPDTIGMVLIKTDSDGGNPVMFFPGHNGDFGYQLQTLNGGGFLIGGVTNNLEKGSEMLLEKLDANGDSLWTKHFGSSQAEAGFAVATDADGNILLAGQTAGFGVNQFDAYLVKLDSAGDIPCPPSVSFVANTDSLCEDENVFFTNTTVSSQPFTWSENGNNFSNNIDASYYFSNAGNYNVTLSACNISSSQNITVNPKPLTHFTYIQSGSIVNFSLDAGLSVQTISWNFGDGSPMDTTDINPSHTYAILGTYWVIVTVTNANGCDSTYIEQINLFTGIGEVKGSSFNLFPNPAHESTMLQTSLGNIFPLNAVMMSVEGRVIKEFILRKAQEQVSVGDLIPGIYFLKLQDSSGFTSAIKLEVY